MPERQIPELQRQLGDIKSDLAKIRGMLEERCVARWAMFSELKSDVEDLEKDIDMLEGRVDSLEHSRTYNKGYLAAVAAIGGGILVKIWPSLMKLFGVTK